MNAVTQNLNDDLSGVLLDYAAGTLSPARHALISCYVDMSESANAVAVAGEIIGASLMEAEHEVALSEAYIRKTVDNIITLPSQSSRVQSLRNQTSSTALPSTLSQVLNHKPDMKNWLSRLTGVGANIIANDNSSGQGERLYLLTVKAGSKMPSHTHSGEEWSLILEGSYRVDGTQYSVGDLHIENDTTHHAPIIDSTEHCTCLVVTDGPLIVDGWVPRIFQNLHGI